jgi:hypothetical protein
MKVTESSETEEKTETAREEPPPKPMEAETWAFFGSTVAQIDIHRRRGCSILPAIVKNSYCGLLVATCILFIDWTINSVAEP